MGRPSFKIDRQRLRELRDERGLSQADLASALCKRLGLEQNEDSRTASYRRIEARGRTSRKRAEAIARSSMSHWRSWRASFRQIPGSTRNGFSTFSLNSSVRKTSS